MLILDQRRSRSFGVQSKYMSNLQFEMSRPWLLTQRRGIRYSNYSTPVLTAATYGR